MGRVRRAGFAIFASMLAACGAEDAAREAASGVKSAAEDKAGKLGDAAKSAAEDQAGKLGDAAKSAAPAVALEAKRKLFGLGDGADLSAPLKAWLEANAKDAGSAEGLVAKGARSAPVLLDAATVLNGAVDDETVIEPIYVPIEPTATADVDKTIAGMPSVEVIDGVKVGFKKLDSMTTEQMVKEEAVLVMWRRDGHLVGFVVRKKRTIDLATIIKETPRLMKLMEAAIK